MVSKDSLTEDCDLLEVAIEIGAEDVKEEMNSEEAEEEDEVCFVCESKVHT